MPAQYPAVNDNEWSLLKKLVNNTAQITGGGGGGTWGSITGTLSNQTDLQAALNAKANTFTADNGLTLTGSSLNIDAAQTTITSLTTPGNADLSINTGTGSIVALSAPNSSPFSFIRNQAGTVGLRCDNTYTGIFGSGGYLVYDGNKFLVYGLMQSESGSDLGTSGKPFGSLFLSATCNAAAFSVGASAGIDATITTGSLVGKTATFTKGILTAFA